MQEADLVAPNILEPVAYPAAPAPAVPEPDLRPAEYTPHGLEHELTGSDPVRLSVQQNGEQKSRYRTLNFRTGFTVTEDADGNRLNIDGATTSTGARVYRTTNQPIGAQATPLSFTTERFDTGNYWAAGAPTRFTISTAGVYLLTAHAQFVFNATGTRAIFLRVGGVTYIAAHVLPGTVDAYLSLSTVWQFSAGNYVEVEVSQSSGATLDVVANPASSPEFAIQRLA